MDNEKNRNISSEDLLHEFGPYDAKLDLSEYQYPPTDRLPEVLRHFLATLPAEQTPIAEGKQVLHTINGLVIECHQRLNLFQYAGVKTITDYNNLFVRRELNPEQGHRYLPNIVLIMDDMQTFLDEETTKSLIALTQQNLYTGIYLIAATSQIMSRNITPQLRANFSIRLAMKLMSQNESRKILDHVGAEKLNPPGELLHEQGDRLVKDFQPLIDYNTIQSICNFIGLQRGYPSAYLLPTYVDDLEEPIEFDLCDRDPLFEEAARLIVMHQQGSTSLIQRKLKLGYNQAGRIVDQLEAAGIVGPFEGSKAREVLYPDEYSLEQYLETLRNTDVPAIPCVSKPPEFDFEISKAQDKATDSPQKKISTKRSTLKNSTHSATLKSMPPDDSVSKAQTNLVMWVFIAIVALIIYLISGWERLVKWFS